MKIPGNKEREAGKNARPCTLRDGSMRGRLAAEARKIVDSIPDVRTDRVERIRDALERGTYRVEGSRIADRMIGDALRDLHIRMRHP